MLLVVAALSALIMLHRLDGGVVMVNPNNVTSLHSSVLPGTQKLLAKGINCAVGLTDGKFVSVIESCEEVRRLIEAHQ